MIFAKILQNTVIVERKACYHGANLCLFEQIGTNLAHIQAENLKNVQKMRFWQKAPVVNGLLRKVKVLLSLDLHEL